MKYVICEIQIYIYVYMFMNELCDDNNNIIYMYKQRIRLVGVVRVVVLIRIIVFSDGHTDARSSLSACRSR